MHWQAQIYLTESKNDCEVKIKCLGNEERMKQRCGNDLFCFYNIRPSESKTFLRYILMSIYTPFSLMDHTDK